MDKTTITWNDIAGRIDQMSLAQFRELRDDELDQCLVALLDRVNGHAAAIWFHETDGQTDMLTIAINVGEHGHEIEGQIHQPVGAGLVSKAFREGKIICHQGLFEHPEKSRDVDRQLRQVTAHQIAGPFRMFERTIGVVSAIQTLESGIQKHTDEWGFQDDDVQLFGVWTSILERLMEYRFLRKSLGVDG